MEYFMSPLPPPPVPQRLREMLKDYPGHVQALQDGLNDVVAKPLKGTPMFEQAVWALEDILESFMSEARKELDAAEASGDAAAIEQAKAKDLLMGQVNFKGRWIGDEALLEYFEADRKVFK
ncbi:hypothetical protein [Marilutibacter maris]|uniref:hypothetical protein n=1 Tax=Marilutibacter maris TaxID=1605891 RepID=UPI001B870BD6|nr:hypothetical protein [Lysobacter maris]